MNPFDLSGPDFLVFYLFLAGIVIAGVFGARCFREGGDAPRIDSSDPYRIAYLRGGHKEAARVAALSLIDRGLLKVNGETIVAPDPSAVGLVRRPIEKAVLAWFKEPNEASSVADSFEAEAACAEYRAELERQGLLPDGETRRARFRLSAGAVLLLVGVGLVKIVVALSRGWTNIEFLIAFMFIFSIGAWLAGNAPARTPRGTAALSQFRTRFGWLKDRAASIFPGGETNELAILAAVYGLGAVPSILFPYVEKLQPKKRTSDGGGCGSSCSSCSSCGGGGCGGGCGGCGS